ncbi:imm11 family protein [Myxococcus faecalis]|uniref:imm11 family protein n=1 Tax=Myxococcus faecalis TaxID=3115646 RepID=UPI0038D256B5
MAQRYFDLSMDEYVKGRWYLDDPTSATGEALEDVWLFSDGRPIAPQGRLRVPISRPGIPLDIEFAGTGLAPVVSGRVASLFREMAPDDVQLFPVEVEGESGPYFILNVAQTVRCIDDAACREVQRYAADDALHSDRAGEYRSVIGLRIDPAKVGNARVFRLWGWPAALIVDEEIKDALEANGISGGRFDEV